MRQLLLLLFFLCVCLLLFLLPDYGFALDLAFNSTYPDSWGPRQEDGATEVESASNASKIFLHDNHNTSKQNKTQGLTWGYIDVLSAAVNLKFRSVDSLNFTILMQTHCRAIGAQFCENGNSCGRNHGQFILILLLWWRHADSYNYWWEKNKT